MYSLDFVYKLGGRFAGFSIIEKDNRAITPYKTTPAPTRIIIVYGYVCVCVCMFMYVYVCLCLFMMNTCSFRFQREFFLCFLLQHPG